MKHLQKYTEFKESVDFKSEKISENLKYHLTNNINIEDTIFRYGSDAFISLVKEVKELYSKNLITLSEADISIINDIQILENGDVCGIIYEEEDEDVNEAEYKGKEVELNKPKRGGSKKFYVYVKNSDTDKVVKVSFGAKSGGGNLAVKLNDPEAKKRFAQRHDCENKTDKTKAGYWSCRLPRYAKLLGLSGSGKWW